MDPIRKAAVAGTWYPGTTAALAAEVDGYLAAARPRAVPGRLIALISPHAGLRYSGPVAAHGYGLVRGRAPLTAVLVGPSHRAVFDGVALWTRGAFETPLGRAPVDEKLALSLLASDPVFLESPEAHRSEHSLEMQLPFLQQVAPGVKIVPMLMGRQSREEVDALAAALARLLANEDALLVASSDLSHYQPSPVAHRLDAVVTDCVERFDPDGLMERLEDEPNHACGGGPMVAAMKAARSLGADRATVLCYADSGDVGEHDQSRVVGYLSAALSASE